MEKAEEQRYQIQNISTLVLAYGGLSSSDGEEAREIKSLLEDLIRRAIDKVEL